jgi:hypothetical protein
MFRLAVTTQEQTERCTQPRHMLGFRQYWVAQCQTHRSIKLVVSTQIHTATFSCKEDRLTFAIRTQDQHKVTFNAYGLTCSSWEKIFIV